MIALSLLPLSYAYAVVKHRVLEVPVLLRRSARYLLVQRGAVGVLVGLALLATLLVARTVEIPLDGEERDLGLGFTLGAGFGTLLAWGATRLHRRVRERIDRAFFRRTYDVHHLLQELATRIRSAGSRDEVARLLEEQLSAALLPRSLAVYLEGRDGRLHAAATPRPSTCPATSTLPRSWPAASAAPTGASRTCSTPGPSSRSAPSSPSAWCRSTAATAG